MKKAIKNIREFCTFFILCLMLLGSPNTVLAQQTTVLSSSIIHSFNFDFDEQKSSLDVNIQKRSRSIGGFPIIFYSDETRWAGGAGIQVVYPGQSEKYSSSIGLIGFYTQNKQYVVQVTPEIYFKEATYKYLGQISHLDYPDKFYDIGNNTKKEDEEDFSSRHFHISSALQKKIYSNIYAGLHYDYAYAKITETEAGRILEKGNITGSEGGSSSGVGMNITWDSRDNNLYPTKGCYHQFSATSYGAILGSDFKFQTYLLDVRHYKPIVNKHILAFQGVIGHISGDPPFQLLNQLGSYLRGYYQTRFQDNNVIAFQAEYRIPIFWRLGFAGFIGIGEVAHETKNFTINELKPSTGFGIRFALIPEQKINLRIDFGFGKDDSSFDIIINELF